MREVMACCAAVLCRVQPQYDVTTIRVPMAVFTGGKDTVIDATRCVAMCILRSLCRRLCLHVDALVRACVRACLVVARLMKLLPQVLEVHHEEEYEHLDFLWADSAKDRVFPAVTAFLRKHMSNEYEEQSVSTSLRIAPRMMAYSM